MSSVMPQIFVPVARTFFQRTGYRYPELALASIDAHVARAEMDARAGARGDQSTHYVRTFHGLVVHFMQASVRRDGRWSMACKWLAPLPRRPRLPFQIVDASLVSSGWRARHPRFVHTGITPLDERFRVYGADVDGVRWALARSPALLALLFRCAEVDLYVDDTAVVFNDPQQKNMRAALGFTRAGLDPATCMQVTVPVHDRMGEILALAARAVA